jgi:hypothetical protein
MSGFGLLDVRWWEDGVPEWILGALMNGKPSLNGKHLHCCLHPSSLACEILYDPFAGFQAILFGPFSMVGMVHERWKSVPQDL